MFAPVLPTNRSCECPENRNLYNYVFPRVKYAAVAVSSNGDVSRLRKSGQQMGVHEFDAIRQQKRCPLCGDIVMPHTKRCVLECVWPPVQTSLGARGVAKHFPRQSISSLDEAVAEIGDHALSTAISAFQWAAQRLTAHLEVRSGYGRVVPAKPFCPPQETPTGTKAGEASMILSRLVAPVDGPKCATPCDEIEKAFAEELDEDPRVFLKRLGFTRVRRMRGARNLYFYQLAFSENEGVRFVALGGEALKSTPTAG